MSWQGECLVRGRVRIEFSTQYKNQQCVRTLCVWVCRGVGKGGAGGVSQHAIRISFKREHVAEILTPRFHLRNCANEPTAGRTHVSEGRRSRRGGSWRSTRRN